MTGNSTIGIYLSFSVWNSAMSISTAIYQSYIHASNVTSITLQNQFYAQSRSALEHQNLACSFWDHRGIVGAIWGSGVGNSTMGIFTYGVNGNSIALSNTTNIYTYSSNSVVAGTSLMSATVSGSACGNDVIGVFQMGAYGQDIRY